MRKWQRGAEGKRWLDGTAWYLKGWEDKLKNSTGELFTYVGETSWRLKRKNETSNISEVQKQSLGRRLGSQWSTEAVIEHTMLWVWSWFPSIYKGTLFFNNIVQYFSAAVIPKLFLVQKRRLNYPTVKWSTSFIQTEMYLILILSSIMNCKIYEKYSTKYFSYIHFLGSNVFALYCINTHWFCAFRFWI